MSSIEPAQTVLTGEERQLLLELALDSIEHGLEQGQALPVHLDDYPLALQRVRASFVTLHLADQLRGCIGHLEALRPAVKDVADNAYAAAFRDPRFPALTARELPAIKIHISLLTPAVEMQFSSEEGLISQLQPGIDGLILQQGHRQGTFLPSVWEQLPTARDFLRHLKIKAGLPPGAWSDDITIARYRTESFPENAYKSLGYQATPL